MKSRNPFSKVFRTLALVLALGLAGAAGLPADVLDDASRLDETTRLWIEQLRQHGNRPSAADCEQMRAELERLRQQLAREQQQLQQSLQNPPQSNGATGGIVPGWANAMRRQQRRLQQAEKTLDEIQRRLDELCGPRAAVGPQGCGGPGCIGPTGPQGTSPWVPTVDPRFPKKPVTTHPQPISQDCDGGETDCTGLSGPTVTLTAPGHGDDEDCDSGGPSESCGGTFTDRPSTPSYDPRYFEYRNGQLIRKRAVTLTVQPSKPVQNQTVAPSSQSSTDPRSIQVAPMWADPMNPAKRVVGANGKPVVIGGTMLPMATDGAAKGAKALAPTQTTATGPNAVEPISLSPYSIDPKTGVYVDHRTGKILPIPPAPVPTYDPRYYEYRDGKLVPKPAAKKPDTVTPEGAGDTRTFDLTQAYPTQWNILPLDGAQPATPLQDTITIRPEKIIKP